MKLDNELIRSVFTAIVSMGYALQGRPDPAAFHQRGRPKQADRAGAEDDLRNALESLKAAGSLQGNIPDGLIESIGRMGGAAWRREALKKVVRAFALIQKRDSWANRQAFDLLGQAVWEKQAAEPETLWEREIKDVWPTCPSSPHSNEMTASS